MTMTQAFTPISLNDWRRDRPDQEKRDLDREYVGSDSALLTATMFRRRCIIRNASGEYWGLEGISAHINRSEAVVHYIGHYLMCRAVEWRHYDRVEILKEEPLPEGKKCHIRTVLGAAMVESLRVAPEHAGLRAQVLAKIKVPLPDEAKTFEQIKDWIETNIDPNAIPKPPAPPTPARPVSNLIIVDVDCHASGTCRFDGRMSGQGQYALDEESVLEIAHDCVDEEEGFNRVISRVINWLREEVLENMPDMHINNETDNLRLDRAEMTEEDDVTSEFDRDVLRTIVTQMLDRLEPETLARLRQNDNVIAVNEDDPDNNPDDDPEEEGN